MALVLNLNDIEDNCSHFFVLEGPDELLLLIELAKDLPQLFGVAGNTSILTLNILRTPKYSLACVLYLYFVKYIQVIIEVYNILVFEKYQIVLLSS